MLQCVTVYCSVLYCVAVCYSVLQCVVLCYSVLQHVVVYELFDCSQITGSRTMFVRMNESRHTHS